MGVHGLWNIIESVGHPVKVTALEGKRLGVDANIWLYKFIRGFREKDNASSIESHKLGLFNRICKLLANKIKPVFVFDGPAPVLKRKTLERRENVRNKQLEKLQDTAMRLIAQQIKDQYPDAKIDDIAIQLPALRSHGLVATEKLTDEDRQLFTLPPEVLQMDSDDEDDDCEEVSNSVDRKPKVIVDNQIDSDDEYYVQFESQTDVDIHSAEFASLPPEVRYEILQDIKESRRKIRRRNALPEDANDFSKMQLQRLKEKRIVQEKIEECERDICSMYTGELGGQSVRSYRMQSDATSTMLYVHNKNESDIPPGLRPISEYIHKRPGNIRDAGTSFSNEKQIKKLDPDAKIDDIVIERPESISHSLVITDKLKDEDKQFLTPTPKVSQMESDEEDGEVPEPTHRANKVEVDNRTNSNDEDHFRLEPETHVDTQSTESTRSQSPVENKKEMHEHEQVSNKMNETIEVSGIEEDKQVSNKLHETIEISSDDEDDDSFEEVSEDKNTRVVNETIELDNIIDSDGEYFVEVVPAPEVDTRSPGSSDSTQKKSDEMSPQTKESGARIDHNDALPEDTSESTKPQSQVFREIERDIQPEVSRSQPVRSDRMKSDNSTNRVSNKIVEEAKELLRLFGIPYIDAAGEAEAQCALLESLKLTEGTITDDSDVWLFGAQNVYRHFFNDNNYITHYKMTDIEFHVRLNRENLVCFAMLVGSDYTDGILNVGPVTALEILSEFPGESMEPLIKFRDWMAKCSKTKNRRPGSKKRLAFLKFKLPQEFPSRAVFEGYTRPMADASTEQFVWGMPELDELREYARRNFGWDAAKIDDRLLPVMKKLSERKTQMTIDTFFFKTPANQDPERFRSKRVNQALNKIAKTTDSEEVLLSEDDDDDDDVEGDASKQTEVGRVKPSGRGKSAKGRQIASSARAKKKAPANADSAKRLRKAKGK